MGSPHRPPDGSIDFSGYSTTQLLELQHSLDGEAYPLNRAHLLAELQRRGSAAIETESDEIGESVRAPAPEPRGDRWSAEYSSLSGLRGWLQAKSRHLRLYGAGAIEVTPTEVCLSGWQRTWLGTPIEVELVVALQAIRNVVRNDRQVGLEVSRGRWRRRWRFEVTLPSSAAAQELVERLPNTRTAGFDERWAQQRQFNQSLRTSTPHVWVTPALVGLNVATYLAMAAVSRKFWMMDWQDLDAWGANLGPLTVAGQWWRLLAAAFLHLTPLHLAVNMWALWNAGRLTERLFGNWSFLALYVVTAILANLGTLAWDPNHLTVGASGPIFGVFGAFLAYLTQQRATVPASLVRAHWVSTLLFVLFSLVTGFLQTGIDNAAHVCGLLSGFALGWLVARPIPAAGRSPLARWRWAASAGVVATGVASALWIIGGIGAGISPTQRYLQSHLWFVSGEAQDLATWQQAIAGSAAGTLSNAEVGQIFAKQIAPFWQGAVARLQKESTPLSQQPTAAGILSYARSRLDWARALVALTSHTDQSHIAEATRLAQETNLQMARFQRIALLEAAAHHLRGLSGSVAMNRLRRRLGLSPACVLAPVVFGPQVAPGDSRTDGPARAQAIGCAAQADFLDGDFAALEDSLNLRAHPLGDLPDGSSTYSAAVGGLDHLFLYGALDVSYSLSRLADWRRAQPHSALPTLLEANLFEDWAWVARGAGTIDTVSSLRQALFGARVAMAAASLAAAESAAKTEPLWYTLSIALGVDQALPVPQLHRIFDQGRNLFPDYLPLDRAMLRVLMPRWYGSYKEVDNFIDSQSLAAAPERRFETYARLYWIDANLEGDNVNIFASSPVSWSTLQAGFEQMISHYPASDYILNGFAYLACRAGDQDQYRSLRAQLMHRFSASAWSNEYTLAACDKRLAVTPEKGRPL